MDVLDIRIDRINVPKRLRPLDEATVDRIAASIAEIGLKQPISVRVASKGVTEDGEVFLNEPFLVAGRHRLAALKQLGYAFAPCVEVADDDLLAQLWEIDENLIRAELSAAEQAAHLQRRKEVWEQLNEGGAKIATSATGQRAGFATDTAGKTGLSKATINRDVARAEALGDDIQRVAGTSLDKGVELDALAKADPEQRADLIDRAEKGEKVSARGLAEFAANESKAEQREWSKLCAAWNCACIPVRERFLEETCGKTDALIDWR